MNPIPISIIVGINPRHSKSLTLVCHANAKVPLNVKLIVFVHLSDNFSEFLIKKEQRAHFTIGFGSGYWFSVDRNIGSKFKPKFL